MEASKIGPIAVPRKVRQPKQLNLTVMQIEGSKTYCFPAIFRELYYSEHSPHRRR